MTDLPALRGEREELSKKRHRAAFATLITLVVAVLAFTRAFRRIDESEVGTRMQEIVTLATAAKTSPDLSYVFSRKWDEMLDRRTRLAMVSMPEDPADRSPEQEALAAAADNLEGLAVSWFSVKFAVGGPVLEFDLRYWLGALPLLLWGAALYVGIIGAKLRVADRIAEARLDAEGSVVDRLRFARSSAYARYPEAYQGRLFLALAVALLIYFFVASGPLWKLLLGTDNELIGGPWIAAVVLFVVSYYVAALVWSARRRLERQADQILGTDSPPFPALRILYAARRAGRRVISLAARAPRSLTSLGAAAVLISPFTMMATTCDGARRSGTDLLLGRNGASWFTSTLTESLLPGLGRWFYAGTIVLAAAVVLTAVFTIGSQRLWMRAARVLRPLAATAALFMLVESSFAFFAWHFVAMDLIRIVAVIVPLVLWLRHGRRERWRSVRARLEVCLLPALVIAPFALARCVAFGLTGLPIYFAGVVLVALPLLAPQETKVLVPAPAVSAPNAAT